MGDMEMPYTINISRYIIALEGNSLISAYTFLNFTKLRLSELVPIIA